MNTCLICNLDCKTIFHLGQHLRRKHKTTSQEYYNKYILKNNIPKCICGNIPNYQNLTKGYGKFCSRKCKESMHKELLSSYYKSTEFQTSLQKRQTTFIKKYGGPSSFCSKDIQHKAKRTLFNNYGVKNAMHNKAICEKQRNSIIKKIENGDCGYTTYKLKKYILPSGKVIKLQGYEPQFLDYVFDNKILNEDEIEYKPHKIPYKDSNNKPHYYFPDFYIPKFNLIVEIKSWYTEQQDKNILLKEQSCYNRNFNYIKIVDHNFDTFMDSIAYYQNEGLK